MAAQNLAPLFSGKFNASIQNFISNDIPIPDEFLNLVPVEHLLQFKKATLTASYWNRRLLEEVNPNTLIIGFLSVQGLQIVNVKQFLEILNNVISIADVKMVFPTESQHFMGVVLKDNLTADLILERLKSFGETTVVYIGKVDSNFIPLRILWATPSTSLEEINKNLSHYFENIDIKREIIDFQGIKVPSGTVIGTASLKPNLPIDKIPYILEMNGNVKKRLLIVIKNRPPICLKCNEKGHLRKQCTNLKCIHCRQFHPSNFFCKEGQNKLFDSTINFPRPIPGLNFDQSNNHSSLTSLGKVKVHKIVNTQKAESFMTEGTLKSSESSSYGNNFCFGKEGNKKKTSTDIELSNPFQSLETSENDFENVDDNELKLIEDNSDQEFQFNNSLLKSDGENLCPKESDINVSSFKTPKRPRASNQENYFSDSDQGNDTNQLNQGNSGKVTRFLRSQKK